MYTLRLLLLLHGYIVARWSKLFKNRYRMNLLVVLYVIIVLNGQAYKVEREREIVILNRKERAVLRNIVTKCVKRRTRRRKRASGTRRRLFIVNKCFYNIQRKVLVYYNNWINSWWNLFWGVMRCRERDSSTLEVSALIWNVFVRIKWELKLFVDVSISTFRHLQTQI